MRTGVQRRLVVGLALGALAAALFGVEAAHAGAPPAIRAAKVMVPAFLPAKDPVPKTVVRVRSLEEARKAAMAMTSPTPAEPNYAEAYTFASGLASANADCKTGRIWISIMNDQLPPQEQAGAGFKTQAVSQAGPGTLTATIAATFVVRGMHVVPAVPAPGDNGCNQFLPMAITLYRDGSIIQRTGFRLPGPGTQIVRLDPFVMEPGASYHALVTLSAYDIPGGPAGGCIVVYDAQITSINWSF